MQCTNPKIRKLVAMYQLDLLPEEQKISVETHLLECDACFQEVYRLSPALEALEEMPEKFLDALAPKETFFTRIAKILKELPEYPKKINSLILPIIINGWRKPAIKILTPVTIAVLITLFIWIFPSNQYSDLAIIKKAPYFTPKFKGTVELTQSEKYFDEGMKLYAQDEYREAISKLLAFLKSDSTNAYGQFYLGISFLLTGDYEKGIQRLKLASELSKQQGHDLILEKCHWHLGNGYLKLNDAEKALEEFKQIVKINREFKIDAEKQISRIEAMQKKKTH